MFQVSSEVSKYTCRELNATIKPGNQRSNEFCFCLPEQEGVDLFDAGSVPFRNGGAFVFVANIVVFVANVVVDAALVASIAGLEAADVAVAVDATADVCLGAVSSP